MTPRLAALVRKELIRPTEPQLAGEDGFRFRHLLIRDAAYEALPKAARAELHERFAAWLEEHGAELVELDEILGYHLEQACLYRAELGTPDDGVAGGSGAAPVGRRWRPGRSRGRQLRGSEPAPARRRARTAGRARRRRRARSRRTLCSGPERASEALERAMSTRRAGLGSRRSRRRALRENHGGSAPLLPRAAGRDGEAGRARRATRCRCSRRRATIGRSTSATRALGLVAAMRAQMDAWRDADEQAFVHAQRAGLAHHLETGRVAARYFGTTPVSELLAWLDEQEARGVPAHYFRRHRALALAMLGRFDEARAMQAEYARSSRIAAGELRSERRWARTRSSSSSWPAIPPQRPRTERKVAGCSMSWGKSRFCRPRPGRLAQALYALDRLDEADDWAVRAAELGASDDAMTQMLSLQVRAKVLARRGERGSRAARPRGSGDRRGDRHARRPGRRVR